MTRNTDSSTRGFTPNLADSKTMRIAAYLDYRARTEPKVYTLYERIAQAINGYRDLRSVTKSDVNSVRSTMSSRVRPILREKYGRELDSKFALGVRATVDDEDTLHTAMPKAARRLETAQRSFVRVAESVNTSEIVSTPANKPMLDWYKSAVRPVLKAITSEDFAMKLLPPGSDKK